MGKVLSKFRHRDRVNIVRIPYPKKNSCYIHPETGNPLHSKIPGHSAISIISNSRTVLLGAFTTSRVLQQFFVVKP